MYRKKKKHRGKNRISSWVTDDFSALSTYISSAKKKRKKSKMLYTDEECEKICASVNKTSGIKILATW